MSNKRRTQKKNLNVSEVILLVVAAVLVATGGIWHAVIKNEQVEVTRQIEASRKRTALHRNEATSIKVQMGRKVDRYVIKNALQDQQSTMREMPIGVIEVVTPNEKDPVASHSPN